MSTIEEQLKALREETLASLKQITAENEKEMQELRVSVLSKKGSLTEILKGMKDVSAEICFKLASVSSRSAFNCSSIVDIIPPSVSRKIKRKPHAKNSTRSVDTRYHPFLSDKSDLYF